MNNNNEIGSRMLSMLNAIGKTQTDLADYLEVSQASVSNWINGIKVPRMNKIDKICEFLKCTRSDLLIGRRADGSFKTEKVVFDGDHLPANKVFKEPLTTKEIILLMSYRSADDETRQMVDRILQYAEAIKKHNNEANS